MLAAIAPLPAQQPADRVFLDSLFARLANASADSLTTPDCASRSTVASLCRGFVDIRQAELSHDKALAYRGVQTFERAVNAHGDWPFAWYGLAEARIEASRAGVVSHQGPLLPEGVSNEAGAGNALVRALQLDSTFLQAAVLLATAPIPREGASRLADRAAMLEHVRRLLPAAALYAAGLVQREAGRRDAAVSFLRQALDTPGVDSGLVDVALARERYATDDPDAGRAALLAGADDTTAAGRQAYRRELSWVASPAEVAAWDSLPAARRPAWLADFWASRDVADGRAPGSRLVEHYRRLEFALRAYRVTIPETGIQLAPGVAGTIDYYADEYLQQFFAQRPLSNDPDTVATSDAHFYNQLASQMNAVSGQGVLLGAADPFHEYRGDQELLDDRGVVYVRQGEPDARAHTIGGQAMELWLYDRPWGPLVLSFREVEFNGQVGASQLVPTLLTADPALRDQLCHLRTSLCSPGGSVGFPSLVGSAGTCDASLGAAWCSGFTHRLLSAAGVAATNSQSNQIDAELNFSTPKLAHEHDAGVQAIAVATTTDAFPQRFAHALEPVVQIYGLTHRPDGAGRLVMTFAVPLDELTYTTPPAAGGRAVFALHFHLAAASRATGREFTLDTLREFASPLPLPPTGFLQGFLELRVPAGQYDASLTVTEGDDRGAVASLPRLSVASSAKQFTVSDLVFGRAGSSLQWHSGASAVPLNPLNAYPRGGTASIYFQAEGLAPDAEYRLRFEFFAAADDPHHPPRLTVSIPERATAASEEFSRTLGLRNLAPGRYRVRLTVEGAGTTATSTGEVTVVR
jgi:hypothetical protein